MAVAVVMEFRDGTLDQYDQVIEKMGLSAGGEAPSGALFHWAAQSPTGLIVTDVWESRKQFDDFAQNKIAPFTQQVGIPNPPTMTFYDVHSHMASRQLAAH